jgi:RNA ligase (TIGR02306 family)
MRKLATVRKIDELNPIEGADKIEVATVGGWKVVCQKGLYNVGDLAVYFEIDSFIPNTVAPFLTKPEHFPKVFEGVEGERLKTVRLRGQLSQGLLMPLAEACKNIDSELFEGLDVTFPLGVLKWEKPIPAQLAGFSRGNFPSLVPKTDQERVQNLKNELISARDRMFEVTEKLEGSSMTCYLIDGEFGVCSRNMNLKETEGNSFWRTARADDVENKMRSVLGDNFAVQGELIGEGIQGNIYKLSGTSFRVFDIYDIKSGEYINPRQREQLVFTMGLTHVPVLDDAYVMSHNIDELLALAEGKSRIGDTEREGLVFKQIDGGMTFKAISNKYLLKSKD